MTYLSHAVRSIRDDPVEGESVRLVLTVGGDADESAVAESVESLGGEAVRDLRFDRLLVEVAQTDVDAVCSLAGVASVETDAVLDPT
ncbi:MULTISPECIES: hypothetical protein [Halorussus]|uniref:hypothetical protein n=1 Tax=Halorussus TaxID=1070314 RepID=UPI0013B3B2CC|nr:MULTISPECIES: hypothetical protein [Halorussus]NHN61281.1 hypothetical protein [Halorussus sp. JP-T4]